MFKLNDLSATLRQTIVVPIPQGDGKTEDHTFIAIFNRLPVSIVAAITLDQEVIDKALVGWEGVGDDKGKPLPFNPSNLAALLDVQPVASYIVRGFYEAYRDAKLGN